MYPYINDTGSGGGQQASGFNPTPAEHLLNMQAQEGHLQILQRVAMIDPMARAATSVFANNVLFPGDPATARKWMTQTQEGQASQQIASMMLSQTGIGGMGSSANMFYGIQNAVANSGMRMGIEGVAGAQQFFGSGFLTDQMSLQVMGKLTEDFYSMGRKTFDSRGLNMTDVGHIMNSGAARGVFAGRNTFDMETYTPATIAEDLEKAIQQGDTSMAESLRHAEPGQARLKLNDQSDKIKKFVQDTGELLGDLKNIYPGKQVEEMLQIAETVAGMGIEEMGGSQAIRSRIGRITNMAQAYGLNPQAMLEITARNNQSIAAQMSGMYGMSPDMYRRTSATFGAASTEAMIGARQTGMEGAQMLGDHGIYQRQFSDEYRASVSGSSALAIMSQEYGAVEALYAADQAGTGSAHKQALRAAVAKLQGAATVEEREAARAEINAAMVSSGWGSSGTLTSQFGGDLSRMTERMSATSLGSLADFTQQFDRQATLDYQTKDSIANMRINERYAGLASEGDVEGTFRTLIDRFDQPTLEAIMKETDPEKRKQLMVQAGMSTDEATGLAGTIKGMQGAGNFNTAFREFQADFLSNPMNANYSSQQKTREAEDRSYQQMAINNSLGRHRLGNAGIMDAVLGAISGTGGGVTEENTMAYMQQQFAKGDSSMGMMLKRNKDGGLEMTTEEASRMMSVMSSGDSTKTDAMLKTMGVGSVDELKAKLTTRDGFQKFHKMIMQDSSLLGNLVGKDGMFVTGEDSFKNVAGAMQGIASTELFEALGLGNVSDEIKKNIMGGATGYLHEELLNKDLTALNRTGEKALHGAIKGDDAKMKAMLFYGSEAGGGRDVVLKGLDDKAAALKEERDGILFGGKTRKAGIDSELKRIQEMKNQLGAGPGEGRKYLGVMSLVSPTGESAGELGVYET
jgi:hypothetical protein